MLKRLTVLAFLLLAATGARAAILLDFVSKTPTGTSFEYKYTATLEPSAFMQPGDYFAIYDFADPINLSNTNFVEDPLVPGHDPTATRWTVSQQDDGPIPLFGKPKDNPTIPNILVTLGGATDIVPNANLGGLVLGTLTLTSPVATETFISNAGVAHSQLGSSSQVYNVGTVPGPVPEPTTYMLMGVGLLSVVGVVLRRRRSVR